jgi:hypothetical protein
MDSGLTEFLRQIPPGFFIMLCGSSILLVIMLTYIFRERAKKARAAVPALAGAPSMELSDDPGDLPDLDMLASPAPPPAAEPPPPPTSETFSLRLSEGETVEAAPVLTILRDVDSGGLIIQIGDKAYRNPPAFADADFRRRFQATLRDLSSSARTPEPKVVPVESPVEPAGDLPTFPSPPSIPGDLPKFKLPDAPIKPRRGQRPSAEPIPEINIAGSIEAFLQHKLSITPEYSGRSIHVRPAMHGAVKIEVDGVFYDSVGEVEDEEVRQYLAATIEEWQARQ